MGNGTRVCWAVVVCAAVVTPAPCAAAERAQEGSHASDATRLGRLVGMLRVARAGDVAMLATVKCVRRNARDSLSLLLLDVQTGAVRRRYEGDYRDASGDWSPDGRCFTTVRRGRGGKLRVGVLDVRSGEWRGLCGVTYYAWPHWTPDGTRIVLETRGGRVPWDPYEVHEVPVTGGEGRVVANGSLRHCWQPFLGDALVFRRVATAPAAGRRRYRYYALAQRTWTAAEFRASFPVGLLQGSDDWVTTVQDQYELLPDYFVEDVFGRPGGHAIVAACYPVTDGVPDTSSPSLRIVEEVTAPNGRELCVGRSGVPAWSPDGKRLLAVTQGGASGDGFVCDIDTGTGQVVGLVTDDGRPLEGRRPQWGRDGQAIIYMRAAEGALTVWRYDRSSRACRQLYPPSPA